MYRVFNDSLNPVFFNCLQHEVARVMNNSKRSQIGKFRKAGAISKKLRRSCEESVDASFLR